MARNLRIMVNGSSMDFQIPDSVTTWGDLASINANFNSVIRNGDQDIKPAWSSSSSIGLSDRIPDEGAVEQGMVSAGRTHVPGWMMALALPKKVKQGKSND